jgi:diguanylate cyclase (GGDEF)-like protein
MFTLEGYTVNELFQQSGQFSIYKGKRNADQKNVIFKICQSDQPNLADLVALQHEYVILKQLNLSCVVHVYDLIKTHNRLVLVMEDIGGTTLHQFLTNGPVSLSQFFKLAVQLTDAIGELHLQNIIHKDINPHNILINTENFTVKLADFGISSELSHESQENRSLQNLQGSLSYFSPEQTGRMNRSVDYRSDFYSLGITFYEMLMGKPPFYSDDTLELMHMHLTAEPESLSSTSSGIPTVVEEIVFKLLAKAPESRYKSAAGLRADILLCQQQWEKNKSIEHFPVGKSDLQDHLTISPKLYGREEQFDILLGKFNSVSKGNSELVFVSGYSGIGKTTLVKELYQPIAKLRGYYFSGKFDQLQRSTPYSAIIEAFSGFVQYCLTEPESQLTILRSLLNESLGNNGQVIVNIIPDVELIIGKQPPLAELPPGQSLNRLTSTFLNFVRTVIQFKHPLVLFIDDLQWIDIASLNLLQSLIEDRELHELLIIGAYRDNEVSANHPLMIMQQQLAKKYIQFTNIVLTPLKQQDIENLISDSLVSTQRSIPEFADLVLNKTNGNPFFVYAILKDLYDEGLLKFSYHDSAWTWGIDEIKKLAITDNVVDLLIARLDKLPEKTREMLKLAACIGHTFDLVTLSTVGEEGLNETARHMLEAIKSSFVVPVNTNYQLLEVIAAGNIDISQLSQGIKYRFIHDKIQQAAYELIPEDKKQQFHLKIGRLLLKGKVIEENNEELFDILNHFNAAISDITDLDEKQRLAQFNWWAGKKAKRASAYQSAKSYINAGISLLADTDPKQNQELRFELKKELAACQYLTGEYELAEENFKQLTSENKSFSTLEVTGLYCELLATLNRHKELQRLALKALATVNIYIPENPTRLQILWAAFKIKLIIGKRKVDEITFPLTAPKKYLEITRLISQLFSSAFLSNKNLFYFLILTNVRLSLRYGYTPSTGYALVSYAVVLIHELDLYEQGLEFCKLYEKICKEYPATDNEGRIQFYYGLFIEPWRSPLSKSIDITHKASQILFDMGDLTHCNYCNTITLRQSLMIGKPISEMNIYLGNLRSFINKLNAKDFKNLSDFYEYVISCLENETFSLTRVNEFEIKLLSEVSKGLVAFYYSQAIKLCFIFGCYKESIYYGQQFNAYISYINGSTAPVEGLFFYALSILASNEEDRKDANTLKIIRKKLIRWASWCPVNYQPYLLLFDAEIARVNKKTDVAIQGYLAAIKLSREQENNLLVAIGYELLGYFYKDLSPEVSSLYYRHAYDVYMNLGYNGKAKQIMNEHLIHATSTNLVVDKKHDNKGDSSSIDLLSLMKSSQAISSEIELNKLLDKLLVILLQNAGAHRVMLLAKDKEDWYVEAEGTTSEKRISLSNLEPFDTRKDLPLSLIRYAQRTQESVLVQTPEELEQYAEQDEYIKITQPQSMLVIPVFHHGELQSILYLENKSVSMAFKNEHIRILQILSSQTAISLQNARLYYQATHDTLTGLANRNLLYHVFEYSANKSKVSQFSIAIMLFDLDYFKKINDTLGHLVGDKVLVHISNLISTCIGKENLAARLGGDEFVAMVEYQDVNEVTKIAEKFIQKLKEPVNIEGHMLTLSSSVGISLFPGDGESISDLLKLADMALYRVKAIGKNQFQFYTSSLQIQTKLDHAEEIYLRSAMEKGEFQVYYQPIYSANGNKVTSFQALLHWHHPEKGLLAAKDFMPAAERMGLTISIGKWTLQSVLEQINKWKSSGLKSIPVSVNVSALNFTMESVNDALQEIQGDLSCLELELTESLLMNISKNTFNNISKLKKLGVKILLADFGTYYAGLTYLREGFIDKIKIDKIFTKGITNNECDKKLIIEIIKMAHSLDLTVVAEGIENREELDFLVAEQVDEVQGYYQNRPIAAEETTDL